MRNVLRGFSRALLSVALVFSFIPMGASAYADDGADADATAGSTVAATTSTDTQASAAETLSMEDALEFVYIETKIIDLGETQNIAVGFVNAENANGATLSIADPNGKTTVLEASNAADGAALFTLDENDAALIGTYTLESITCGDGVIVIESDTEDSNTFEVIEPASEDDATCEEGITFYSISDDGTMEETDSLTEAIAESTDSSEGAVASLLSDSSSTFVVALDPGHGGTDSGAVNTSQGLYEKNLTLKISQYCKAELETYAGVSVYMTRTTDEYVGLEERITRAVAHNADVFVSIHINSAGSTATGFEVWAQNDSSWRYSLHTETYALGNSILSKLSALGLTNRGVKEKDYSTSDGASENLYYNNGSGGYADYYSVLRNGRYNNLPSIIVEHLFINGSSADVAALKSESKLKQMGVADATGIAEYYKLGGIEDTYDSDVSYAKTINNGEYYIQANVGTNMVVDIDSGSTSSGANAQIYTANKTGAQKFVLTRNSSTGYYTIKNANSGLFLGLQMVGSAYRSNVVQLSKSSSNHSTYWIVEQTGTSYTIRNAANPDYVLDIDGAGTANGTNVQVYKSNSTNAQKFNLTLTSADESSESAKAQVLEDGLYTLTCKASGKVIDVASGSTEGGANIQQYESNDTAAQKFMIEYDGEGYYTICNIKSGRYLTIANSDPSNSTNVYQEKDGSLDTQKWSISKNSDGSYTLLSKNGGLALDIDGASTANSANAQVYASNGTSAQKFSIVSAAGAKAVSEGTYYLTSKLDEHKTVDISGASKANGANAQLYDVNNTDAQRFTFTYDSATGFYTITCVATGKVLDVNGGTMANGINVWQYESNNTLAQRWVITKDGSYYKIASALDTTFVLDVNAALTANGTNIQIYKTNGTNAQRFDITETATKPASYNTNIMGTADTTVAKMVQFYKNQVGASTYPSSVYAQYGASNITTFCQILYEQAVAEGVKPGILFCQAMLETGWLKFGGDVSAEQCNFGGIGATGGGVAGVDFRLICTQYGMSTSNAVRIGLRAQAQHLKAYASTDAVNGTCYDPRFNYVRRGCAPTLEGLTGTWAASTTYANNILALYKKLQAL